MPNTTHQVFLIEANQEAGDLLQDLFDNDNSTSTSQNTTLAQDTVPQASEMYCEDVEALMKPLVGQFAVYESFYLFNENNKTESLLFNSTHRVSNEGVYSTYFYLAKCNQTHHTKHNSKEDLTEEEEGDLLDDILGLLEDGDGTRRLRASNKINLTKPHVEIRGQISFVNSFGFLNAQ